MRVTLSPGERAITETTLALANRKRILGNQKRGLFALQRFTKTRLQPHIEVESLVSFDAASVATAGGKVTEGLLEKMVLHHHAQLKKWLAEIARRGLAAYPTVAPEVGRYLPKGSALRPTLQDGRVVYKLTVNVIPGLLAYGTALILDRDRGLAQRLGQCGYCGRFNLTFEGRPRTHCNESHRLAYDRKVAAERMRAYRKRQLKKLRER